MRAPVRCKRMYFHIDESGNTGNNLFDVNQPTLSYGMLSSARNVDALGRSLHREMLRIVGADQLHANQLRMDGLARIADPLTRMQRRLRFNFDFYYIHKPAFVVTLLFDAVFDSGINPAAHWIWYWTPLRFAGVYHLGLLLDENLAKEAHRLCLVRDARKHREAVVALLQELRYRTRASGFQPRVREVFDYALAYGIDHPDEMDFGTSDAKLVSPNAVAFQFICHALARRARRRRTGRVGFIKVDRQQQFNRAQETTHYLQGRLAEGLRTAPEEHRGMMLNHPLFIGFNRTDLELKGFPDSKLQIATSADSIGLQIVDVYLWLMNRVFEGVPVPAELVPLVKTIMNRGVIDSISMEGMEERYRKFDSMLPQMEDITDEQAARADEIRQLHQARVDRALGRKT